MASKKKNKKQLQKQISITIVLGLLVLSFLYVILNTNVLEPHLNEMTTSYISFNNLNTTDMMKIKNIKRMSNYFGNSKWNSSSIPLTITGEKNKEYEIILYTLTNDLEDKYIMYSIVGEETLAHHSLENLEEVEDGGKILYQGNINNNKMVLRLWISKKWKDKVTENAFEVKVKPR